MNLQQLVLRQGGNVSAGNQTESLSTQKFLSGAFEQARRFRKKLIKSGQLVDADAFCTLLGIQPSALTRGLEEGRFFSVDVDGKSYFPAFYSDPGLSLAEVEAISCLLLNLAGSIKWQFFNTPKLTLNGITPLAALAQGRFDDVAFAARGFVEL